MRILTSLLCIVVSVYLVVAFMSIYDLVKKYDIKKECVSNGGAYIKECGSSIYRCVKFN